MNAKSLAIPIIGGVAITLLTGLVPNTEPGIVVAIRYGYPFYWLVQMVVAPQYFPWTVNPLNLIVDVVIWIAIACSIFLVLERIKR